MFGNTFTHTLFNFIVCSRNGLRESDLEMVLPKQTSETWDPLRFANLRRWFRMHLVEQGENHQWNLAHSILKNTLLQNLTPEKYNSLHFAIATHLLNLPVTDSIRASETMFHLLESEKLEEAANYYGGNLTEIQTSGATAVMAEDIAGNENGLKKATQLPHLLVTQFALLQGILRKYIYILNNELTIEGNLLQRLTLLTDLFTTLEDTFELKKDDADFGYDYAALSVKFGKTSFPFWRKTYRKLQNIRNGIYLNIN